MSLLLNPVEPVHLNDETEDLYFSGNENDDYNFKYVPTNHFKYIIKDVRRQRCREQEESVWTSFVRQQELNGYNKNGIHSSVQSIKQLLDEGMREADKELKKLETNILPDEVRKDYNKTGNNQKRKSKVNNIRDSTSKKVPIMKDTGTGSTNLLLTIPEEDNAPAYERRHQSEDFKSYARKSRSGHVIPRKKQSSRQLHHATNGTEYNSSPESSARHNGIADGVIYVRPDPFTMHKILTMQRKVCELLDEIAFRLGNISAPDGIKDLQRRQQCVAEFIVRFSRNYLYDLNRYVKDIQRHMCVISPRAIIRPNHRNLGLHMHAIEHKLLAAHQLLLHALVAYCKHVPSSIPKGHPGKLKEILQVVLDLKTMCDRLHLNYFDSGDTDILSLGKEIESKCNAVLSKFKLYADNDFLDTNKTSSIASITPHSTNKKRLNRKQLSNRLSMYSADTKISKNISKPKTNYHQKDKKYNAINVKRISNRPYPSPVTSSKDANQIDVRKHRTFAKEEDIKTMMDILPIDSDGSNFETQERHNNAMLTRRICKTPRKYSSKSRNQKQSETIENIVKNTSTNNDDESMKKEPMITEEHLSNLVPVIADFMSFVSNKQNESEARPAYSKTMTKTLMKFLQKYQLPKSMNAKINASTSCDVCYSDSSECEYVKTNRTLTERRKNGENMQLICMSSIEDASKVPRYCDASCQADYKSLMELPDFETKVKEGKFMIDSLNNIELAVSEETEMNFLKYRCEYQRLMESIPMYSSNTQNKPWDIVAWISDKLVDELIIEIAKELQIDDVIQKLFELEFQEF
ncbi:PREDICTED: uncharacterized protein LOC108761088 isoform X1 [Trachymyrmex cornetzi]|uniref:Uncharacterized protein n=2 Tax=Trachymyrmex cornetzi TaxID=471704 RepID=A0A195E510_9HYME|nr:PREDICTED: uncharacterized protein LOC108761088 isoform X1 [Trachymyrmex cornetzi]KYN19944.1 hypothetical protein ALC57_07713 [Trachymyrmex cornetzi]